jgi:NADH:ubiquinone oxidoreductase subunit F (NADH-binding)
MGTTLRDIIEVIGGGIPDGKAFKAVQTGGPSGGCVPEQHLDIAVDYDSLKTLGTMMGSGGMIVMDETSNMVDVARFFMEFCMDESCGKCVPCRAGTQQMHGLLTRSRKAEASREDLALLEELCEVVQATSLCGLGRRRRIRSRVRCATSGTSTRRSLADAEEGITDQLQTQSSTLQPHHRSPRCPYPPPSPRNPTSASSR